MWISLYRWGVMLKFCPKRHAGCHTRVKLKVRIQTSKPLHRLYLIKRYSCLSYSKLVVKSWYNFCKQFIESRTGWYHTVLTMTLTTTLPRITTKSLLGKRWISLVCILCVNCSKTHNIHHVPMYPCTARIIDDDDGMTFFLYVSGLQNPFNPISECSYSGRFLPFKLCLIQKFFHLLRPHIHSSYDANTSKPFQTHVYPTAIQKGVFWAHRRAGRGSQLACILSCKWNHVRDWSRIAAA